MCVPCSLLHPQLLSMNAHKAAIQLLSLPFTHKELIVEDVETRAVLRGSYRLLKAMTTSCAKTQLELLPSLPIFLEHTHAQLVSYDVSPTECITAVFKGNRTVCSLIDENIVPPEFYWNLDHPLCCPSEPLLL